MQESMEEEAASSSNRNLQDSEFTVDSLENEPEGSGAGWFGGMGTDFLHCLTENVSPVVSGVASLVHKTAVAVANEIAQLERDGVLEAEAAVAERSNQDSGGTAERGSEAKRAEVDCSIMLPTFSSPSFVSTASSNNNKPSGSHILQWEICQESSPNLVLAEEENEEIPVYFTDTELMKNIFLLSRQESTFLQPFSEDSPEGNDASSQTTRSNVNGVSVSLSSFSSTFVMDEPRIKLIRRLLDIDNNLASIHSTRQLTGE